MQHQQTAVPSPVADTFSFKLLIPAVQLYLSEGSLGVAITTAKSSAINVVVLGGGDSDPLELPVPEQFVSTFQNGKLVTEAVTHSGA